MEAVAVKETRPEGQPAPLEKADRTLRKLLVEAAGGAFDRVVPLARALGHTGYSPRNRLLIGAQLPGARKVASPKRWEALGYQVRPGERGAAILAPGEGRGAFVVRFVFSEAQVEPAYLPSPLPAEDLLPALERWSKPEDGEGVEGFLRAGLRMVSGVLKHARDGRLWEELKQAELWMAAQGLEALLGVEGVVPPLPEATFRRAFGSRPAVLQESLLRVGEALKRLEQQVGLAWQG